jgi:hypothetical protein
MVQARDDPAALFPILNGFRKGTDFVSDLFDLGFSLQKEGQLPPIPILCVATIREFFSRKMRFERHICVQTRDGLLRVGDVEPMRLTTGSSGAPPPPARRTPAL